MTDVQDKSKASTKEKIRVLLVDDSKLFRMSLKTTLNEAGDSLELLDEAEDGQQAVELAGEYQPDIILMDVGMPIMDGIVATQKIREAYPEVKVIMLTSHEEEHNVLDAFQSGATSYCLKETTPEQLVNIIKTTHGGACWIDPKIAHVFINKLQPPQGGASTAETFNLTEREIDVLKLLSEGKNNSEISEGLHISLNTVKTHLKNIFMKLEVEDRTAAALKALKERII